MAKFLNIIIHVVQRNLNCLCICNSLIIIIIVCVTTASVGSLEGAQCRLVVYQTS